MNTRELAEHYKINILTVYSWIKKGCPSEVSYHGKKLMRKFDVKKVDEWILSNRAVR
jgi:DNA-binding CsgD family transcriptional regulator